jgi:hypothetical protein
MLSRRWLINYVLIVLVVVFTYIGNRYGVETGYQPQKRISALKPADIQTISMQTADTSLALKRSQNGWTLEAPVRWPANNINVERLLTILNNETDSRLGADEIDLASIGLQYPTAILQLNDTQILFGATNNIGERRYILIGSTVFLLPDIHLPFLSQGLSGFVDRRLLPRSFDLVALKLPEVEIIRENGTDWRSIDSTAFPGEQVRQLVENWQGLEAKRLQPLDSRGLPRQKLHLRLRDGSELEFFVMSIEPELVIANPELGVQYHFPRDLYYQLISLRADEIRG